MTNLVNLLDHVISLTEAAADLLVKEWEREGGPRGQGDKADVDREIEVFLRSGLLRLLDADFWGEETSQYLTRNPYCWVVDPHDGTADFCGACKAAPSQWRLFITTFQCLVLSALRLARIAGVTALLGRKDYPICCAMVIRCKWICPWVS